MRPLRPHEHWPKSADPLHMASRPPHPDRRIRTRGHPTRGNTARRIRLTLRVRRPVQPRETKTKQPHRRRGLIVAHFHKPQPATNLEQRGGYKSSIAAINWSHEIGLSKKTRRQRARVESAATDQKPVGRQTGKTVEGRDAKSTRCEAMAEEGQPGAHL